MVNSISLKLAGTLLLTACSLVGTTTTANAATNEVPLVSRATGISGSSGSSSSGNSAISANGRYVAFSSDADNLSTSDSNAVTNIFVRDLEANTTTLVSQTSDGSAADGNSDNPTISADGRYVAFDSLATNLSSIDRDSGEDPRDVFVRDLTNSDTSLVSRAPGSSGPAGDLGSYDPSISASGHEIAFTSSADNFSDADTKDSPDDEGKETEVFLRDTVNRDTLFVSRATGADGAHGNSWSMFPSISGDGKRVAFVTGSHDLVPGSTPGNTFILQRDLATNTTLLISRKSGASGDIANGPAYGVSSSADGRYVAFTTSATNLDPVDGNAYYDSYVRDTTNNTTRLASRTNGAADAVGDHGGDNPSISADGRYVSFQSSSDNLSAEDLYDINRTNSGTPIIDVYVRDMQLAETHLVSRARGDGSSPPENHSLAPAISADGKFVSFQSAANNLNSGASEDTQNVYRGATELPTAAQPDPTPNGGSGSGSSGGSNASSDSSNTTEQKTIVVQGANNSTQAAPALALSLRSRQRLSKQKRKLITVTGAVSCTKACSALTSGEVALTKKVGRYSRRLVLKVAATHSSLAKSGTRSFKLTLSKQASATLRRFLVKKRSVRVLVRSTATDSSGNKSAEARATTTLLRAAK